MGLFLIVMVLGRLFFNDYRDLGSARNFIDLLIVIVPFAPMGTLFGTLKESQSTRTKLLIIALTFLSILLLLFFIWGVIIASAFD